MAEGSKGWLRRVGGGVWGAIDGVRRLLLNLLFLAVLVLLGVALVAGVLSRHKPLQDKTVLVLDLDGVVLEQHRGGARDAAVRQAQGESSGQVRLRDVLAVLDAAARDPQIERVLLLPEDLSGGGLQAQREVAAALERFKAAGKPVVAWASAYDQRQYYLAAHANEVFLHPMGAVVLEGYGRLRNYYRDALDRLGVSANVLRVGRYKNAAEPYFTNAPSAETLEAEATLYDALWGLYAQGVEKARKLQAGSIAQAIEGLPASLKAVNGDTGKLAVSQRLVDGLKTRDELRQLLIERGAADESSKSFRQVRWRDYLQRLAPAPQGDAVGVVVAEGEIGDGQAPPGRVGGRSTADLIRQAREDAKVKAVVLRVNSPGGSALGSEFVRRELELTRQAGKPVVVSMGDVAASGGYWISLAADEVIADAATITGSIGVFGMLPTGEGLMDKLSVRTGGHATTWLSTAYDPRKALDPRYAELVQSRIDHIYADFTAKVAAARKSTPQKIDEVAQGRVWTGAQALERGLIDRNGSWADALAAARKRAQLGEDTRVQWIERSPGRLEQVLQFFSAGAAAWVAAFDEAGLAGLAGVAGLAGPAGGVPPVGGQVLRQAREDLAWLAEVAERRAPWPAAFVHCLCGPAE